MDGDADEITIACVDPGQSGRRPLCAPAAGEGWKTGYYFGFSEKILRERFMYNSVPPHMKNASGKVFDTHERDGLWWCTWKSGDGTGPTPDTARALGYTIFMVKP